MGTSVLVRCSLRRASGWSMVSACVVGLLLLLPFFKGDGTEVAKEPVRNRITKRPTRPFWSVFQPKPSAWFIKQSDLSPKNSLKIGFARLGNLSRTGS